MSSSNPPPTPYNSSNTSSGVIGNISWCYRCRRMVCVIYRDPGEVRCSHCNLRQTVTMQDYIQRHYSGVPLPVNVEPQHTATQNDQEIDSAAGPSSPPPQESSSSSNLPPPTPQASSSSSSNLAPPPPQASSSSTNLSPPPPQASSSSSNLPPQPPPQASSSSSNSPPPPPQASSSSSSYLPPPERTFVAFFPNLLIPPRVDQLDFMARPVFEIIAHLFAPQDQVQPPALTSLPEPELYIVAYPPVLVRPVDVEDDEMSCCAVCMEDFEVYELVNEMPCLHMLHCHCVATWLTLYDSSCPVCRMNFLLRWCAVVHMELTNQGRLVISRRRMNS